MKNFRIYLLMRNDMASMTIGRVAAQAHHASDAIAHAIQKSYPESINDYIEWKRESKQEFGTVIVLACDKETMYNRYNMVKDHIPSVIVHDETYRINDGAETHYIPVDTCACFLVDMTDGDDKFFSDLPLL